ncbi:SDR family oxidoreductase [Saccharicrinis aurantiacus]|uniref:SDR family oxidoreductase n=1 Tax=Saccharicrinis aurantiacus TaxID=1849719 RepID=UPI002491E792|nr:SDR family oxidoreductase [Saccharicrinis aurantiacus]
MRKIIINGANGYVASNFINELLDKGYEVIALVRGNKKLSANERMYNVLEETTDGKHSNNKNLKVFSYGLLEADFGLSKALLKIIFSGNFDYYHFAANLKLKYDLKSRDEIFSTNIDGLENSLNVYNEYSNVNSRFFFISTAYSCGKHEGVFEEKFYDNADISEFRNYYEQSKRYAENVVKKHIDDNGTRAHVIRLSQVVGHSTSGITKTDYGIFDFAKRMYSLSNRYPNKKVRMVVDSNSTQNLIPIDTVVNYLKRTVEVENPPVIINCIAKYSTPNRYIIDSIAKLMPISIIPVSELDKNEMEPVERLVSVGMSFTGNYISTNLRFDTTQLDSLDKENNNTVKENNVAKMLEYFINTLRTPKGAQLMPKAS